MIVIYILFFVSFSFFTFILDLKGIKGSFFTGFIFIIGVTYLATTSIIHVILKVRFHVIF